MTRDEIIRMAREVGIIDFRDEEGSDYVQDVLNDLERFAALVTAAEREACAKLCDDMTTGDRASFDWERGASDCAHAIRARNQPPKGRD